MKPGCSHSLQPTPFLERTTPFCHSVLSGECWAVFRFSTRQGVHGVFDGARKAPTKACENGSILANTGNCRYLGRGRWRTRANIIYCHVIDLPPARTVVLTGWASFPTHSRTRLHSRVIYSLFLPRWPPSSAIVAVCCACAWECRECRDVQARGF